jgi:hypothetical protein
MSCLSKITAVLAWVVVNSFFGFHSNNFAGRRKLALLRLSSSISASVAGPYNGGANDQNPFDADFADMFSKPIPTWFDKKSQEEDNSKKVLKTREEILAEFRTKFEAIEAERKRKLEEKWAQIQKRMEEKKRNKGGLFGQAASLFKSKDDKEDEIMKSVPKTLEEMERYLESEESQQNFALPGFFEVFPELQWPKWARRRDGSAIECDTDSDCPLPLTCCNHPILPGPKFCCSGWGQRMLVKAYAYAYIKPDNASQSQSDSYSYSSCY